MTKPIPLSLPSVGFFEALAAFKAVRSGWLTQFGGEVHQMEKNINDFYSGNSDRQIQTTSTSNGTTALHLALLALGVSPGDEVVIPNLSYIAVANAVLYCGAKPVVVDVSRDSWNIDLNGLLSSITQKTKAVVLVDNYGVRINSEVFRKTLPRNIAIIHDCAESFPAQVTKNGIGGADLVTLSCYANKVLTAGEGGAVIGNPEAIERIKILKNQAQNPKQKFSHSELGFNYRITNMQAAVFNVQWRKRERLLKRRQKIFQWYFAALSASSIKWDTSFRNDSTPWLFTILVENSNVSITKVIELLKKDGVESRPGFTPIASTAYLVDKIRISGSLIHSNELSKSIISLPTYPKLRQRDIKKIVNALQLAIGH
ncbi:perosamine synthetase [Candidatus Planktophila versatilis]|uniref:Perosamine synthetase n=1 Tax=Candidatus Planktophila versatilis TaxID=1884905 RepID=A0AAC9YVM9_9ACTN|nr:DegT/DnrJ/EryC1/StrS aminotransferase family protein [Candidatus Planktophila versatilis]ASY22053.1 perosamine synthetase [Candidatus Planktophila versatilis]